MSLSLNIKKINIKQESLNGFCGFIKDIKEIDNISYGQEAVEIVLTELPKFVKGKKVKHSDFKTGFKQLALYCDNKKDIFKSKLFYKRCERLQKLYNKKDFASVNIIADKMILREYQIWVSDKRYKEKLEEEYNKLKDRTKQILGLNKR